MSSSLLFGTVVRFNGRVTSVIVEISLLSSEFSEKKKKTNDSYKTVIKSSYKNLLPFSKATGRFGEDNDMLVVFKGSCGPLLVDWIEELTFGEVAALLAELASSNLN